MRYSVREMKEELGPLLQLAWPVVLSECGWMAMGIVDTMMVGRLGAEAIGAVSVGSIVFFAIAIFGIGLLLGMDTLVSQAFGAGKIRDCHRALFHGVYLSLLLILPLMLAMHGASRSLELWGVHARVRAQAIPYMDVLKWSLLPLLFYASFRRYLQAMNLVKPVLFALLSANLVNAFGNWILIFGNLGAPALGVRGAAWATCISRAYTALFLVAFAVFHDQRRDTGMRQTSAAVEWSFLGRLVSLGLPAALQITLEVGVFAVATVLVAKLSPAALAAHQIALQAASFTFMVPLGVSSAAAVRVGQAVGRHDRQGVARSGWTALLVGTGFMAFAAAAFVLFPGGILRAFTPDSAVIRIGVSLLFIAALFQLFDGLQVVVTGILRGIGDTRTPMLCNLVGHWLVGLPIGYGLCFWGGRGVVGLWIGLSTGLIAVGAVLLYLWTVRVHSILWKPGFLFPR